MEKAKVVTFDAHKYCKEHGIKINGHTIEEIDKVTGDLDGDTSFCVAEALGYRKVDLKTAMHVAELKDISVLFSGNLRMNTAYVKYIEGLSEFKELGATVYDIERKYLMHK